MLNVFDVLLSVAVAFTITFLAIPAIVTVATHKLLFDFPDERKVHHSPVPSLGGLGIFAGFSIACLLAIPFSLAPEFQYFLAAAIVIFFLGLKDDILVISPIKKFIGQVMAAFLIIYKGGVQIKNLQGFLGIYEIPEMFSLMLTYFSILVIINSFNLIDGVDGLAGSLGMMATVLLGCYFLQVNMIPYAIFAFTVASSLFAFLIFNFQPAKVFMGDTGSMLLGLLMAASSVMVTGQVDPGALDNGSLLPAFLPIILPFSILAVPLTDLVLAVIRRSRKGRSPFAPDKEHLHHKLMSWGNSQERTTVILYLTTAMLALPAMLSAFIPLWSAIAVGVVLLATAIVITKRVSKVRV